MFFYKLIVLLIYALPLTPTSAALKCYSCGEENTFLGPEYPNPSPCEEMEKSPNFSEFIIECPNEYMGCITQIKGNEIMRTCDVLAIDDCQTANGIKYCYCSKDLCNYDIKISHNDARKSSRDILDNYPSDDEDYDDDEDNSSGMGANYHNHHNNDDDEIFKEKDTMHREIEVVLNRNSSSRNISNNYNLIITILFCSLLIIFIFILI